MDLTVILFIAQLPMHVLQLPSFLGINMNSYRGICPLQMSSSICSFSIHIP